MTDPPKKRDPRPFRAPPLLYLGPLTVGVGMNVVSPARVLPEGAGLGIGVALIILGAVLLAWAVLTMRRAGTSPEPWQPVTTLVTWGPYRRTRNPIYVAYTLLYVGIAALLGSLWVLALLPVAVALLQGVSIGSEERYLEDKFGDAYRTYKARVRRWF